MGSAGGVREGSIPSPRRPAGAVHPPARRRHAAMPGGGDPERPRSGAVGWGRAWAEAVPGGGAPERPRSGAVGWGRLWAAVERASVRERQPRALLRLPSQEPASAPEHLAAGQRWARQLGHPWRGRGRLGAKRACTHGDEPGEYHRDCRDEAQTDHMPLRHFGIAIWGGHAVPMQAEAHGVYLRGRYGSP